MTPPKNLKDVVNLFLGLINPLIIVLAGLSLLWFIRGLLAFIFKSGDEKAVEEGKARMIWGIIGLFVFVGMWGVLNLLNKTFLPSTTLGLPLLPTK